MTQSGISLAYSTNTIVFTNPVAVTAGNTYSWVLFNGPTIQLHSGQTYANGHVIMGSLDLSSWDHWDLYFYIHMGLPQAITGLAASPSSGTAGGSSTLSVTGSGSSGNPVTYASTTTGICTVSGSTVTYVAVGTCTVTANQAGADGYYDAAAQVSLNIPVAKGSESVELPPTFPLAGDANYDAAAQVELNIT